MQWKGDQGLNTKYQFWPYWPSTYAHGTSTSRTDGWTDRQTDGRTTYDSNIALVRASRGNNIKAYKIWNATKQNRNYRSFSMRSFKNIPLRKTASNDLTCAVKSITGVTQTTGAIEAARYVGTIGRLAASSVVFSTFIHIWQCFDIVIFKCFMNTRIQRL